MKTYLRIASVFAATAVILGAFGAHLLQSKLQAGELAIYRTGIEYHFYHSIALLCCSILAKIQAGPWLHKAVIGFSLGIIGFSGSLYLLACRSIFGIQDWSKLLGPITPIGGTFFILAWICLFLHANQINKK